MTYISGGTTRGLLRLTAPATTPALSVAGEGRIYFDGTQFQASQNGAAYTPVVGGGGGGGGWTDDGTVVRLTTVTDGVGIGTATPAASSKLEVLGDATRRNLSLTGGTGVGVDQPGGGISITGGNSTGAGLAGAITITTGLPEDTSGSPSGALTVTTGDTSAMTNGEGSGAISILSGGAAGTSGDIEVVTGDAAGGNTGFIQIATGGGAAGNSGDISLTTGSPAGTSGSIFITVGNAGGLAPCGGISISTPGGYSAGGISISSGKGAVGGGGSLVLSGGESLVLRTPDIAIGDTTANVIVLTGDAAGIGEQTGSISIDVGVATGGATPGQINIGMTNQTTVNIGGGAGGGTTTIFGGVGAAGGGTGGSSIIQGGAGGSPGGNGGGAFAVGGAGDDTGIGGAVQLTGGLGGPTDGEGGGVLANGGNAQGSGTGGAFQAVGGAGGATGNGGGIILTGGAGGTTSGNAAGVSISGGTPVDGNGGSITITGSNGVGTNRNGGNITLTPGAATGSGTPGATFVTGVLNLDAAIYTGGVTYSGGSSYLLANRLVDPQAGDLTLTDQTSRTVYTNEGAAANITLTLPAAVAGLSYTFFVRETGGDSLIIQAGAGDTIRIAANVSTAGGTAESNVAGDCITLVAINSTEWVAVSAIGTWPVT